MVQAGIPLVGSYDARLVAPSVFIAFLAAIAATAALRSIAPEVSRVLDAQNALSEEALP